METRYLTVTIHPKHRPCQKRPSGWTIYARLSVLALAAMMTARLAMLMIDVIQAEVDAPGAVAIPLYAAWLIFTGWKLREWMTGTTKEETVEMQYRECPYCGDHLDPGEVCDCRHGGGDRMEEKTMRDLEGAREFCDVVKPGDAVAAEIVEDFRDCLPPTTNRANLMQSGEPSSYRLNPRTNNYEPTYITFQRRDGQWYFCGCCFEDETEEPPKPAGATA